MDSVDYTKSLNKQTRKFYDQLGENREAAKKEAEAAQNLAETKTQKQYEVHKNQLNENEKAYQDRVETISQEAKNQIEKKSSEFHNKVKGDREQFSKQKEEQLNSFNGRINQLSDSYRKNAEEQDKFNSRTRDMDKERFSKKSRDLSRKHEMEIDDVYDKSRVEGRKLKSDLKLEEETLAGKQRREINNMNHEHYTKREREAADMKRGLEQIKQNSDDINFHSQQQVRDNYQRLNQEKEHNVREIEQSFADANQKVKQAHADEKAKIVKNHKDQNMAMERQFNKDKTNYEQEVARKSGDDFMGQYNKQASELKHKDQLEQKKNMYSSTLSNVQKKYNDELQNLQDQNAKGRRDDAIANAKMAELRDKQFSVAGTEQMEKANKQRTLMMDAYTEKDKIKDEDYGRMMNSEKESAKNKYNNLMASFSNTVQDLSDKSLKEMNDQRDRDGKERTKLIQENRVQTNMAVSEMRKEAVGKLNRSSTEYERRLEDAQSKMAEMQRFYEDKIAQVRNETTQAMDRQQYIHAEQRKQDADFMKGQMIVREEELNRTIDEWRARYNRDLNTVSFDYERKMKGMMNEYETKMSELRTDQDKERSRLTNDMMREIERMKIGFDSEKSRTIQQYENAIAKLKDANMQKSAAVEEYKKEIERNSKKA